MSSNKIEHTNYILEQLPYGILIENPERKIHSVNQALIEILDIPLTNNQLIGLDCGDLAVQVSQYFKDQNYFNSVIEQCLATKKKLGPFNFEMVSGKFVELNYIPYYADDNFIGHSWCYSDVSLQKQSELKLKNQSLFFSNILNTIPADIVLFNTKHEYLFLNSTAIKNPELRSWMIGKTDFDYCEYTKKPVSIAQERRSKFLEVLNTRKSVQWEDQMITKEGKEDVVLRILHPYINDQNEVEFVLGYGINVTAYKISTLKLSEEEAKNNFLERQIKSIIFTCDSTGNFKDLNTAWENITGYDIKNSLNKNILNYISDKSVCDEIINYFNDEKRDELLITFELNTKQGDVWMETFLFKERYINQKVKSIWGSAHDVDKQKKEQKSLLNIINREKELNELKSQFVNMVSHEVRTPLAGILSSMELLQIINQNIKENSLKEKNDKHFNRIKDQIIKIGDLMNDVLLLGRIEAGKVEANSERIDLHQKIINFLKDNFNFNEVITIHLIVIGKPKLIKLDWGLMHHVFTNLLSNALKYSKDKENPELTLNYEPNKLKIIVKDKGIGIPKDDLKDLFTPFKRGSNVGSISGTGLGLVLVKYFVELHHGIINVESEQNSGTQFTIELPYDLTL